MKINTARSYAVQTAGGGPAYPHMTSTQALRRSVLSCLLWESEFYEEGQAISDRISALAAEAPIEDVAALAVEARAHFHLRHVPLLLLVVLSKRGGRVVSETIAETIQRPDELAEFLALYWKAGKRPLGKQVKKGLGQAFKKFNAYSLAKYNRDGAIKLRDVLFLVHAKPNDDDQAATWKLLVDGKLPAPDTWEVALSGGADKKVTFERLIREGRLGYLALLRNLRNMEGAGCDMSLVRDAILARNGAERVLPFRYVAAVRACPQMAPALDQALSEAISQLPLLAGRTAILVDVSGSMDVALSSKSDLRRIDAACALASLIHGDVRMFSFSDKVVEVPPYRGLAGVDALIRSQAHSGTRMAQAVTAVNNEIPHGRIIVITDEQSTDGRIPAPIAPHAYMVNVASNKHGVGYGKWTHIDGFSEGVLRFISEAERGG